MAVWGYIRVSSKDQNEGRQVEAIKNLVTTESHLVIEKVSGKNFDRPKYQSMKNLMNQGDSLVILSLDRLGRDYEKIKEEWRWFADHKIHIRVLDMPILNTEAKPDDLTMKLISDVVLELLSYVAESERKNIKQRQKEGIAMARAKGVHFGRPKVELPENWESTISLWENGEITAVKAMQLTGIKRSTFYNLVKEE